MLFFSAVLYFLHYLIFRDVHHIFIYMLGDLAFMPIEVLLVTIIVHRLLEVREKRSRMEKLNMVIGAFFSEMGMQLLGYFAEFDTRCQEIRECLAADPEWEEEDFRRAESAVLKHECEITARDDLLDGMRLFLLSRREFLLTLLENPALLEHETFTDLLWSVFHLTEELKYREILENLPEMDTEHLCADIARAYRLLIREWLVYLEHLKKNYPYLYSLALRMNPLGEEPSPVIR
ncbi:MAG: hypothetical protein QME89_11490 [Actinomycetota bacterium]|nr:hypothetical protein [Actinomycetota bacterium]